MMRGFALPGLPPECEDEPTLFRAADVTFAEVGELGFAVKLLPHEPFGSDEVYVGREFGDPLFHHDDDAVMRANRIVDRRRRTPRPYGGVAEVADRELWCLSVSRVEPGSFAASVGVRVGLQVRSVMAGPTGQHADLGAVLGPDFAELDFGGLLAERPLTVRFADMSMPVLPVACAPEPAVGPEPGTA